MWILPKQLHTSAFVQDTKASGLDCEEFSQICERSLSWRGKDSQSRTWLQRWKRENWMQPLCTRTLRPSHTESFVDKWTSYLEASRANHSAKQDLEKQLKTLGTCSPTSQKESVSADQQLCFSKMYKESLVAKPGTENQFSCMSSEHWKDWVTEQRQEYSQRKKSAHLTRESEYSSWPTPTIAEVSGGMRLDQIKSGKWHNIQLREKIALMEQEKEKNWATPQVTDVRTDVRMPSERSDKAKKGGCKNLREEVMQPQNWPTITVDDSKNNGGPSQFKRISNGKPRALNLNAYIKTVGHQDPENPSTNGKSQELQGKLNPNWVEHLMGLPVGWTDLGYWETE